mmetsp:Transcript_107896/g.302162  ORF Transcript_107896/g.302162 Transcript_107896/m.302162 type:complete len:370 (-) Transcript_107896:31-1140(-)
MPEHVSRRCPPHLRRLLRRLGRCEGGRLRLSGAAYHARGVSLRIEALARAIAHVDLGHRGRFGRRRADADDLLLLWQRRLPLRFRPPLVLRLGGRCGQLTGRLRARLRREVRRRGRQTLEVAARVEGVGGGQRREVHRRPLRDDHRGHGRGVALAGCGPAHEEDGGLRPPRRRGDHLGAHNLPTVGDPRHVRVAGLAAPPADVGEDVGELEAQVLGHGELHLRLRPCPATQRHRAHSPQHDTAAAHRDRGAAAALELRLLREVHGLRQPLEQRPDFRVCQGGAAAGARGDLAGHHPGVGDAHGEEADAELLRLQARLEQPLPQGVGLAQLLRQAAAGGLGRHGSGGHREVRCGRRCGAEWGGGAPSCCA